MAPSAINSKARTWGGYQAKFSKTRTTSSGARAAAATMRSNSARVRVGGFCRETCLPASIAATA